MHVCHGTLRGLTLHLLAPDAHFAGSQAMLDINLGDRTSYPIADRLAEMGVPFLFATGYGDQAQLPEAHADRTVVQKPYTLENVARAMDGLINPAARA